MVLTLIFIGAVLALIFTGHVVAALVALGVYMALATLAVVCVGGAAVSIAKAAKDEMRRGR